MSAPALWGRTEFLEGLLTRFPTLAARQDPSLVGLLHCEMGWFSHETLAAIKGSDFQQVRAHFEFIDEALGHASGELENAILVSYLENVFGIDPPAAVKARDLLTPALAAPVREMEGHFFPRVNGLLPPIARNGGAQASTELAQRIARLQQGKSATHEP